MFQKLGCSRALKNRDEHGGVGRLRCGGEMCGSRPEAEVVATSNKRPKMGFGESAIRSVPGGRNSARRRPLGNCTSEASVQRMRVENPLSPPSRLATKAQKLGTTAMEPLLMT